MNIRIILSDITKILCISENLKGKKWLGQELGTLASVSALSHGELTGEDILVLTGGTFIFPSQARKAVGRSLQGHGHLGDINWVIFFHITPFLGSFGPSHFLSGVWV